MEHIDDCRVIELRQYTLHPGRRDELITLFEREFIETQEAVGLHVLGIFRDAQRPERFVWLRGFADMASRARGLAAFYGGPVWAAHREAANATMIDSSDVLLLRPLTFPLTFRVAFPVSALPSLSSPGGADPGLPWQVVVCPLAAPPDTALVDALRASGGGGGGGGGDGSGTAWLETEPAENTYPRLPVRSGETVVVGLARGHIDLPQALHGRLSGAPQVLQLLATRRSPLR